MYVLPHCYCWYCHCHCHWNGFAVDCLNAYSIDRIYLTIRDSLWFSHWVGAAVLMAVMATSESAAVYHFGDLFPLIYCWNLKFSHIDYSFVLVSFAAHDHQTISALVHSHCCWLSVFSISLGNHFADGRFLMAFAFRIYCLHRCYCALYLFVVCRRQNSAGDATHHLYIGIAVDYHKSSSDFHSDNPYDYCDSSVS